MDLSAIRFQEAPHQHETLALSLISVAASADIAIDYDDLCAALGLSCTAVSTVVEPSPGWWMTYGRDAFVEPAARLFGIELRNLQPSDVAVDMLGAEEFGQHWEYSYKPLIRRAMENGQPVIAWHGWPEFRWPFWGVITAVDGDDFTGCTLWSEGEIQRLGAPALQCYVVERLEEGSDPPRLDHLFPMALANMDAYLNSAPFTPVIAGGEPPKLITGPAAYRAWIDWLDSNPAEHGEAPWNEHRQHAEFIGSGHESGAAFLRRMQPVVPAECREMMREAIERCEHVARRLASSRDPGMASALFGTPQGRNELLDTVRQAAAEERLLADVIHELAGRVSSDKGTL